MNQTKKGFTLVEVIMIIIIISLGIVTVVGALNSGNKYLQRSREKIIAINLAREGVEQMFNIRDTNWKRNAGAQEESRLKLNPMDNSTDWFASGSYILLSTISGGQQYFYGSGITTGFNINSGLNAANLRYSMCQNTTGWEACPGSTPKSVEGQFFRRIKGIGLYQKYTNTQGGDFIDCKKSDSFGAPYPCKDTSAKEYRFCVIVDYIGNIVGKVELCSVLTNFKKN